MSTQADLSDEQVLLLATHLASTGQVEALGRLVAHRGDLFRPELLYRILLTCCPHHVPPTALTALLQGWQDVARQTPIGHTPYDAAPVTALPSRALQRQVQRLYLQPLPESPHVPDEDLLSRFLLARAYQTDSTTDDLISIAESMTPFLDRSPSLRMYFVSHLLPLLRLKYEYYPGRDTPGLSRLELLHGRAGVGAMLEPAIRDHPQDPPLGRDLRGIVAPWIYGSNGAKRRKMRQDESPRPDTSWHDVNDWILEHSVNDLTVAEKAFGEWNGPGDVDLGGYDKPEADESATEDRLRYCQAGLAAIYATSDSSASTMARSRRILRRVSELARIDMASPQGPEGPSFSASWTGISRAALMQNALLTSDNALTKPTTESVVLVDALLDSVERLQRLRISLTVSKAAMLCLFGAAEQQLQELRRILHQVSQESSGEIQWSMVREQVLYLQSWGHTGSPSASSSDKERRALLGKLDPPQIELEILKAMLSSGKYAPALSMFAPGQTSLSPDAVRSGIVEAIYHFYDNASNSNRTRGGMQRAHQMLKTFQPQFPESSRLREIDALITATHALSFYQLTLQHGVPFQPVNIRIHSDPLSLVEKVLDQNSKAYTHLDDLLGIGRNFVRAGLPTPKTSDAESESATLDAKLLASDHRITYLSVTSALAHDDFDTAYSYITTRLTPSAITGRPDYTDDTSWRAALAAGQYGAPSPLKPPSLPQRISILSRRMELLSLALSLAPTPAPLPQILEVWCQCEQEMERLKSEEQSAARAFDAKTQNRISLNGASVIPGGFGSEAEDREVDMAETTRMAAARRAQDGRARAAGPPRGAREASYDDEAPMGLFEVAGRAASAFQRSARGAITGNIPHPARGGATRSNRDSGASLGSGGSGPREEAESMRGMSGGSERVRKRDVVSNMVTGGLVSGMSWVLGAQPVAPNQKDAREWDEQEGPGH